MTVLLSYIWHSSYEILKYSVWYFWKYGQLSSGITTSWPANQSDAKLLEGGVDLSFIIFKPLHATYFMRQNTFAYMVFLDFEMTLAFVNRHRRPTCPT